MASARCTSMAVTSYERSAIGSRSTLIWRLRPPMILTSPTPSMLSIWRRTTLSASSVVSRIGCFERSAAKRIGDAPGSILLMTGWSIPFGRSGMTRLTLSRTSCAATSTGLAMSNVTTTIETPSLDVERSSSMPLIVLTAPSILSETSLSISSALEPGRVVVTTTIGKSTLGNWSRPSFPYAAPPSTTRTSMSTVAKTGRWIQTRASHCMRVSSVDPDPAVPAT